MIDISLSSLWRWWCPSVWMYSFSCIYFPACFSVLADAQSLGLSHVPFGKDLMNLLGATVEQGHFHTFQGWGHTHHFWFNLCLLLIPGTHITCLTSYRSDTPLNAIHEHGCLEPDLTPQVHTFFTDCPIVHVNLWLGYDSNVLRGSGVIKGIRFKRAYLGEVLQRTWI